jgi:hypothetical protein
VFGCHPLTVSGVSGGAFSNPEMSLKSVFDSSAA